MLFTAPNVVQCGKTCRNEVLGNGVCDDECNQSTCAFDAGDCINGQHISPNVGGIGSVHIANHLTTLLELTRLFGGVDRYKRPHEPIMINKNGSVIITTFRALENPKGHNYLFMCVQDGINHE